MEATIDNERTSKGNMILKPKNNCPLEAWEQEQVFLWRDKMKQQYPILALMHSSGNGLRLTPGTAVKAKKQGLTKGIPDIFLPAPTTTEHGDCYGLFIELKRKTGGKVSPEQIIMLKALNAQGFLAVVCYGADEAIETIKDYLNIKE